MLRVAGKIAGDDIMPHSETGRFDFNLKKDKKAN